MTAERIAELRSWHIDRRGNCDGCESAFKWPCAVIKCLDEIERLRAVLTKIATDECYESECCGLCHEERARDALDGGA